MYPLTLGEPPCAGAARAPLVRCAQIRRVRKLQSAPPDAPVDISIELSLVTSPLPLHQSAKLAEGRREFGPKPVVADSAVPIGGGANMGSAAMWRVANVGAVTLHESIDISTGLSVRPLPDEFP